MDNVEELTSELNTDPSGVGQFPEMNEVSLEEERAAAALSSSHSSFRTLVYSRLRHHAAAHHVLGTIHWANGTGPCVELPGTRTVCVPRTRTVCVPGTRTVCVPGTRTVCVPGTELVCARTRTVCGAARD
ncbi:hypothetical protein WMY93_012901 [Mugilogobius chulae]|uniref:Uncharacterized protein n=1 Tax=Mugilogobius chulae TaxID=88201 RepID=A0AAW0P7P0_9GOBI